MAEAIIPLLSLIALEVILGIDNIIFISILADKLPGQQQKKLRLWGLTLAMLMRLILLAFISWILKLDQPLFYFNETSFTGKSLILIAGGLFLLYKSTKEIYHKTEMADTPVVKAPSNAGFGQLLGEVILLDLVFCRFNHHSSRDGSGIMGYVCRCNYHRWNYDGCFWAHKQFH